jgi:hypothetical protein
MSWGQRAVAALEGGRGEAVALEAEGIRVRFRVEEADRVGCAILGLRAEDVQAPVRDADGLKAWADRVAGRITYLMERVSAIEVDGTNGLALLRSDPPDRRGESRAYYEVVLKNPGTLTLARYRYRSGDGARTEVPCALTREVFERLVDDLAGAMRD